MPEYLTPGVYFEVQDPAPTVRGIRTDIAGFVGLAERGPLDRPVRLESWRQFQATFGSFVPWGYLAYGVKGFFDNGGRTCFVVRTTSNSARPASLTLENSLKQPVLRIWASSPGTWGGGVQVTVVDANAAAGTFSLRVRYGSDMELYKDLSTDPANERWCVALINDGSEYVRSSRWINLEMLATAPTDLVPATEQDALVNRSSKLDDLVLILKNRNGDDAIVLTVKDRSIKSGEIAVTLDNINRVAGTFRLTFVRGSEIEVFDGLDIDPVKANYALKVLNTGVGPLGPARWARAALADLPPADLLPDVLATGLAGGTGYMTAGRDGLATLQPEDLLGDTTMPAPMRRGLAALALVDEVGMLAIPDIHIRPTPVPVAPPSPTPPPRDPCLYPPVPASGTAAVVAAEMPPGFSESDVLRLQQALVLQCEELKDRFAILDAPLHPTKERGLTVSEVARARNDYESERGFAALYYPWVKVVDPIATGRTVVRTVPPSGHVAGLYARTDLTIGVHKAPANGALEWAEDVAYEVSDEEQGILNPLGVNCIRPFPGRGIRVFGARTISSNSSWRYVNVRRLMMMIEEAVDEATQWAVFEPNNILLRQGISVSISSFLEALWRKGSLAGASAEEAYFVRCDDSNNPQSSLDQGKLIVDVGVAPATPAEFVIFRIGRTSEELEIVER